MSAGRAARRRAERKGEKVVTYDESNPAYIPTSACHGSILTPEHRRSGRFTFPPFTSLSASGIEQCATLLGVHGPAERRKAVAVINRSIQERWRTDG